MADFTDNIVNMINARRGGFNRLMGLKFVKANPNEFVAEIEIEAKHLQPYGLVHGGVYSGMIETLCSTGAALSVIDEGKSTVGLENSTSFLRAVRSGTLRCTARPLVTGKRSQVWEATIHDDRDRLVAIGRVRMIVLEPGAEADGKLIDMDNSSLSSGVTEEDIAN
jgi:uncharacterized protein (TIGR00369 family)